MNGRQPRSTSHPGPIELTFDDGLWPLEMLRRCWRATRGRIARSGRRDLYISSNGRSWEVELRQGGTKGRSVRWMCGSEAEAQRLVEGAVTATARWWPG